MAFRQMLDEMMSGLYGHYQRMGYSPDVAYFSARTAVVALFYFWAFILYILFNDYFGIISYDLPSADKVDFIIMLISFMVPVVLVTKSRQKIEELNLSDEDSRQANIGFWGVFWITLFVFILLVLFK